MKKNGVFLFLISHLVPAILRIFVLCILGTDDVIRCVNMEVKTPKIENISASNDAKQLEFVKHVVHQEMRHMMHILMLLWQQSCFQSLSAVNQMLPV